MAKKKHCAQEQIIPGAEYRGEDGSIRRVLGFPKKHKAYYICSERELKEPIIKGNARKELRHQIVRKIAHPTEKQKASADVRWKIIPETVEYYDLAKGIEKKKTCTRKEFAAWAIERVY